MIKETILKTYSTAAKQVEEKLCCGVDYRKELTSEELDHLPSDVLDRNYGCGVPAGLKNLELGQQVLDLGPGIGRDCFIASRKVGSEGQVFGLDMNDNMIRQAEHYKSQIVAHLGYNNIHFLKGQFDIQIPLANESIDVIISNCVNNLAQDKSKGYSEIFRVLKFGSQLSFSDIVSDKLIPEILQKNETAWADCISGVLSFQNLYQMLKEAGFYGITLKTDYLWKSGIQIIEDYFHSYQLSEKHIKQLKQVRLYSVAIEAFKPAINVTEECHWKGHQALFRGPGLSLQIDDDPEHIFKAGELKEVCEKTATILRLEPFNRQFTVFEPQAEVESRPCLPKDNCC